MLHARRPDAACRPFQGGFLRIQGTSFRFLFLCRLYSAPLKARRASNKMNAHGPLKSLRCGGTLGGNRILAKKITSTGRQRCRMRGTGNPQIKRTQRKQEVPAFAVRRTGRRNKRQADCQGEVTAAEPPTVEVTFEDSGTTHGIPCTGMGTYTSVIHPDGSITGEAHGITMTGDGDTATWTGTGIAGSS